MGRILALLCLVIIYGSLYPFTFSTAGLTAGAIDAFLTVAPLGKGRGDIVANIVLFIPYGLFAGLIDRRFGWIIASISGISLSLTLQLLQFFVPSRDPSLDDVIWNAVGLVMGILAARFSLVPLHGRAQRQDFREFVPLLLIGVWLAYRLLPFVPMLDLQAIKDGLKLLLAPELSIISLARNTLAWSMVLLFAQQVRSRARDDQFILVLVPLVLLAELFIRDHRPSLANLGGAALAVLLWWSGVRRIRGRNRFFAAALAILIVIDGTTPLQWSEVPAAFNWVPFSGALDAYVLTGLVAMTEKVFLYGSLPWLLQRSGVGWRGSILITVALLAIIEALQIHLVGRTPEVTDPLLALILGLSLRVADPTENPSQMRWALLSRGDRPWCKTGGGSCRDCRQTRTHLQLGPLHSALPSASPPPRCPGERQKVGDQAAMATLEVGSLIRSPRPGRRSGRRADGPDR